MIVSSCRRISCTWVALSVTDLPAAAVSLEPAVPTAPLDDPPPAAWSASPCIFSTTTWTAAGLFETIEVRADFAGAALNPIIAKLREVRTHLDGFEEASGDPTFVVEKIEKILDQAAGGGSSSGAVGTAGSSDTAAAGGSVTLSATQVQEMRRQLETIKAAAKR